MEIFMKEKTKQPEITTKAQKVGDLSKLITDVIPPKKKTDEWVKALLESDDSKHSKKEVVKVIDYLKKELAHLKSYQNNAATCRLNLRTAVHFLDVGGYEMLGYESLKACLEKELSKTKSLSTLYREAEAASLEVLLFGKSEIGKVRESVLRPLSKLKGDPKKINKAWNKAMAAKPEEATYPTGKMVTQEVNKLLANKTEEEQFTWNKAGTEDLARSFAPKLAKQMAKYQGKINEKRIDKVLSSIKKLLLEELSLQSE
jgi:negative regulator of replication initiation